MNTKDTKEQQQFIDKTNSILSRLEREYKSYNVAIKFLLTDRDDFDTEKIKKGKILKSELKRILDILPNDIRGKIQYGTQFSLGLTYNHIWSYYYEIKKYLLLYIEAKN